MLKVAIMHGNLCRTKFILTWTYEALNIKKGVKSKMLFRGFRLYRCIIAIALPFKISWEFRLRWEERWALRRWSIQVPRRRSHKWSLAKFCGRDPIFWINSALQFLLSIPSFIFLVYACFFLTFFELKFNFFIFITRCS